MTIKPIFVDTSALIAIGNKRDFFHEQAVKIKDDFRRSNRSFVITSAVILEFGNAFCPVNLKSSAIKIIESIMQSKKWKNINVDEKIINKAFEFYKQMKDKEWGLVDCSSIVVAKEMGIREIFTTDHHFEQAGFTILLQKQI
ncbi:MAG: type II toxin-antitoxin system VapC family toxin [Desulfobacterales bacterium]|nr:type II toxin-antitoxin system VapC family toxin [Desulfobacterales bacterium]